MKIVDVASGTADVQGFLGRCDVVGLLFVENAASTATVNIHDGTSASGAVRYKQALTSGQAVWVVLPCVPFATGVWVERLTGTTIVSIVLAS